MTPPTVAISTNTDGSATARMNLALAWSYLESTSVNSTVYTGSIVPTLALTDNTKANLFSIGTSPGGATATPNYGLTSLSAGLMFVLTQHFPVDTAEEVAILSATTKTTQQEIDACLTSCNGCDMTAGIGEDCTGFCSLYPTWKARDLQPAQFSSGALCDAQKTKFLADFNKNQPALVKQIIAARNARALFPKADISLWGGGGASHFAYYAPSASGSAPPGAYSNINKWLPNGGVAMKITALPFPVGFTFELPAYLKLAYQASKTTGSACKPLGTGPQSGATLSSCSTTQPIELTGGPSFGADLVLEGYLGWVERTHGYARVAFGGGIDHSFVTSTTVWSLKTPIYINGTAPAKSPSSSLGEGSSGADPPKSPVPVNYDGIVRVVPTFQYTAPDQAPGPSWTFLVAIELMGAHNLFPQADNLVK